MPAKGSEQIAVVAVISPQLLDDATATTGWLAISGLHIRYLISILLGATDITVDAAVSWATDGSGTGATVLKSITQFSATDDNEQALIDLSAAEFPAAATHWRLTITAGNGTTGAQVAALIQGIAERYVVATQPASVSQVV